MSTTGDIVLRREFESRIFVSLGIVALVCSVAGFRFPHAPSTMVLLGGLAGGEEHGIRRAGFVVLSAVMAVLSVIRMWAGSELTPGRVMSFRVRADTVHTEGPYRLVRNPIYLADFAAICSFALCLPPVGLLMPLLFLVHYLRLIRYEESSLDAGVRAAFRSYAGSTPRIIPSLKSLAALSRALGEFRLTREGIRHNALYLLFVPGFLAAAWTDRFIAAALIGLPGVADWAVIHTKIGVRQ